MFKYTYCTDASAYCIRNTRVSRLACSPFFFFSGVYRRKETVRPSKTQTKRTEMLWFLRLQCSFSGRKDRDWLAVASTRMSGRKHVIMATSEVVDNPPHCVRVCRIAVQPRRINGTNRQSWLVGASLRCMCEGNASRAER